MDRTRKILIFRLSSLGDVVLATSVLDGLPRDAGIDWVVSAEYASLLQGHPRLGKVWAFDRRSSGLMGWVKFCRRAWEEGYGEILDLHRTLRTRIARLCFAWWNLSHPGSPRTRWRAIRKQRLRNLGYFIFKSAWPARLRPTSWVKRYSAMSEVTSEGKPRLDHLTEPGRKPATLLEEMGVSGPYVCVMPGSLWEGKRWPAVRYVEVLRRLPDLTPVILGGKSDLECFELASMLSQEGMRFASGVGKWSLKEAGMVLAGAEAYLGNDTGLAHLAEAVGTPAVVIFGPTSPMMGFGPWRTQSVSIATPLWCSPCGKDGRFCFRVKNRFACLKAIGPDSVSQQVTRLTRSDRSKEAEAFDTR